MNSSEFDVDVIELPSAEKADEWLRQYNKQPGHGVPAFVRDDEKANKVIDSILAQLKAMGPQPEPIIERDLTGYEWYDYRNQPTRRQEPIDYQAHTRMLHAIKGLL